MMKTLIILGTRPEAIKLSPVIKELEKWADIDNKVLVTAQHREMLDQVLTLFDVEVDYDLNIMKENQSLADVMCAALLGTEEVLKKERPDFVLVQGDTTTTLSASLGAFYHKIPLAHVEAGLRTNEKYQPFPEEINRILISRLADLHFAPTEQARNNLLSEGIDKDKVFVTGNTVIDALKSTATRLTDPANQETLDSYFLETFGFVPSKSPLILITGHRRENFGQDLKNICLAIKGLALNNPGIQIVYPVHMNPNVQNTVRKILNNTENIFLIDPLEYLPFIYLMIKSRVILTDSGGIQEEAPYLNKPVLVMRDVTERPEVILAGAAKLVGTNTEKIVDETQILLEDPDAYREMTQSPTLYGKGDASERIVQIVHAFIDSPKNTAIKVDKTKESTDKCTI